MLTLLVAHIIISFSCLVGGCLFYNVGQKQNKQRPFVFYLISGLILLTLVAQIIVLFFPLTSYVQYSLVATILLCFVLKRRECTALFKKMLAEFRSWLSFSHILFFISWLLILFMNAGPVIMDDSESYHIQSIKWIREYGSVPGLVNLHERFGFNSSWFSSAALFCFSNKLTGGFTVLNSVLSLWLCYWCISKYNQFQNENNFPAAFTLLLIFFTCIVVWPLLRGNAATTNYDFIATCIVFILFTEIFFSKEFSISAEWIIWPAYLFTVRIINFPLLLLSVIALVVYAKQKSLKSIVIPIACCLLLVIPFIIRNIIIAGYPFYPAMSMDLVPVDWKPDPQMTETLLEYIKYYNRVSTTYLEIEQTKALGKHWLLPWFRYLFSYDKVLMIAGITGLACGAAKRLVNTNKLIIMLRAISLVWIICWFFISPDPRFIYGILLFGVLLLLYLLASIVKEGRLIRSFTTILLVIILAGTTYYAISKIRKQEEYRNWLTPARLPQPPSKEHVIDGITFRIPEPIHNNWNARCYATELPCLYKIDSRLKARGKDIRSGFRLEK